MRILFLTSAHNGLSQRLQVELEALGHRVTVELASGAARMEEAARLAKADVVVCPMLDVRIPAPVWGRHVCLVVHPGVVGDRGPSSLDWAILEGEGSWGVTVLQAAETLDAGPVWASAGFPMRTASKASIYRIEVTDAAAGAVTRAIERFERGGGRPLAPEAAPPRGRGRRRPRIRVGDRVVDWSQPAEAVSRVLRSADTVPGALAELGGRPVFLYGGRAEPAARGAPGTVVGKRHGALCVATGDGGVWVTHVREPDGEALKVPAATGLGPVVGVVAELAPGGRREGSGAGYGDVWYAEDVAGAVGFVHFDLYNGAMGTEACRRLQLAIRAAARRPTRVLVLAGGTDFFSNGIDLNTIEVSASPAMESWRNVQALNDVVVEVVETTDRLLVSALHGNAAAGGVPLAAAADEVWCRRGVVLNAHYRSLGGLHGSEYWTYLLPRRVGTATAHALAEAMRPVGAAEALGLGLVDRVVDGTHEEFHATVASWAAALAAAPGFADRLRAKQERRRRDEAAKALLTYGYEELQVVRPQFFTEGSGYHRARSALVRRQPPLETPPHLAHHRGPSW